MEQPELNFKLKNKINIYVIYNKGTSSLKFRIVMDYCLNNRNSECSCLKFEVKIKLKK